MKQCMECGVGFEPSKFTPVQRFCSKRCADKHSHKRASARRIATCKVCGKEYHPKEVSRTTCCSRECGWKYQQQHHMADRVNAAKAKREKKRIKLLFERLKQCIVCKAAFVAVQHKVLTCGHSECKRKLAWLQAEQPIDKRCDVCGDPVAIVGKYRGRLCGECRKQAVRLQKRRTKRKRAMKATYATAKHKSAEVLAGINQLIDQAGSQCPCCGLLMSRAAQPNTDRYLELDHALPLSKGGSDHFPNLRPMCRRCNGLKAAFVAPEIVIGEWIRNAKQRNDLRKVQGGTVFSAI